MIRCIQIVTRVTSRCGQITIGCDIPITIGRHIILRRVDLANLHIDANLLGVRLEDLSNQWQVCTSRVCKQRQLQWFAIFGHNAVLQRVAGFLQVINRSFLTCL
ncbi:hypothetical protein D3C76_1436110 [compost metagenome]